MNVPFEGLDFSDSDETGAMPIEARTHYLLDGNAELLHSKSEHPVCNILLAGIQLYCLTYPLPVLSHTQGRDQLADLYMQPFFLGIF